MAFYFLKNENNPYLADLWELKDIPCVWCLAQSLYSLSGDCYYNFIAKYLDEGLSVLSV